MCSNSVNFLLALPCFGELIPLIANSHSFLHILTLKNLRSMRHTLASAILGLFATHMICEDVDLPLPPTNAIDLRREVDSLLEPRQDVLFDRPGESLSSNGHATMMSTYGSCTIYVFTDKKMWHCMCEAKPYID